MVGPDHCYADSMVMLFEGIDFAVLCLGRSETHPKSWRHLSFHDRRPYQFRHDNSGCPGHMLLYLSIFKTSTYPGRRKPAFLLMVISKINVCGNVPVFQYALAG